MYKKVTNWILALAFVATTGGAVLAVASPATYAAPKAPDCSGNNAFLTLPGWYRGLATLNAAKDGCDIAKPGDGTTGLATFIWTIVLNIIDILLQVVAYLSVFFIIYGGFQYITSAGSSEGLVNGRKTITNALIGLVISILSVAIVNIVAGAIS